MQARDKLGHPAARARRYVRDQSNRERADIVERTGGNRCRPLCHRV